MKDSHPFSDALAENIVGTGVTYSRGSGAGRTVLAWAWRCLTITYFASIYCPGHGNQLVYTHFS